MLADDGYLLVKCQAERALRAGQLHLHALVGRDDRQRALAAEDRQRVVARLGVDGHDAAGHRRFDAGDLGACAGLGDLRVQIPQRELQVGDGVVDLVVGEHGKNIARLHLVADGNAQIGQRAVRLSEHIGLIARGGRARAVHGFRHCAAHHLRLAVAALRARVGRLVPDISLQAK